MTSIFKSWRVKTNGNACDLTNLKHEKLVEEFNQLQQNSESGSTYHVKYIGSCLVKRPTGEDVVAEAIKMIVSMAKASGRKFERVELTIYPERIRMVDESTHETHLEIAIPRISYCSADAHYNHVSAFISTNKNDTYECHAFTCPKKKIAQELTLTIAEAFQLAFEVWKTNHVQSEHGQTIMEDGSTSQKEIEKEQMLIDLNVDDRLQTKKNFWQTFDDDFNFSQEFVSKAY